MFFNEFFDKNGKYILIFLYKQNHAGKTIDERQENPKRAFAGFPPINFTDSQENPPLQAGGRLSDQESGEEGSNTQILHIRKLGPARLYLIPSLPQIE
jgi:hypothetical protein